MQQDRHRDQEPVDPRVLLAASDTHQQGVSRRQEAGARRPTGVTWDSERGGTVCLGGRRRSSHARDGWGARAGVAVSWTAFGRARSDGSTPAGAVHRPFRYRSSCPAGVERGARRGDRRTADGPRRAGRTIASPRPRPWVIARSGRARAGGGGRGRRAEGRGRCGGPAPRNRGRTHPDCLTIHRRFIFAWLASSS